MKKILIILGILLALSFIVVQLQQYVSAITVGIEPPAVFMNNLKNCTKGTFKDTTNKSMINEYTIKGLLPNGRCEFTRISYTDYSNRETYEAAKKMLGSFAEIAESMAKGHGQKYEKTSEFPSQAEMIKMTQDEKDIMTCKLSKDEINMLYQAWQKHDDKNPPAKVTENEISFSWSSSKMSSYDYLMMKFAGGPCSSSNDNTPSSAKKYSCEYADTTCYWTDMGNGASTMQCTKENSNISTFKLMDKVKEHVKAGYCQEI